MRLPTNVAGILCPLMVMAGALGASAQTTGASVTQYLVALPHMAFGGPWQTVFLIRNTGRTPADVDVSYFGSDGNPLDVTINGTRATHTTVTVPANGETEITPDPVPATVAGWAAVSYANGGISAQAVFQWTPPGSSTEAVAPIISRMPSACIIGLPSTPASTMPFDNTGGKFSGYAFANTTAAAVTLDLIFFDESGQQLAEYKQPFAAFGHDQFLLRDHLPQLNDKKGTMQINGLGMVPLGFRFSPSGTFTTWLP